MMKNELANQGIAFEFLNNRQYETIKNEEFRMVHSVGNFKRYYYYISNLGNVLVFDAEEKDAPIVLNVDSDLQKEKYQIIPVQNGYLNTANINLKFDIPKLATETDVYTFTIEAGWLDIDEAAEIKKLAQKIVKSNYPNDRLEVHHINNNPSDNSIKNLIWLPKSIHQLIHTKQ